MRVVVPIIFVFSLVVSEAGIAWSEVAAKKVTKPGDCLKAGEDFCEVDYDNRCTKKQGAPRITGWRKVTEGETDAGGNLIVKPTWLPEFFYACDQTGIWDETNDLKANIVVEEKMPNAQTMGYTSAKKIGRKVCFVEGECYAEATPVAGILYYYLPIESASQPFVDAEPKIQKGKKPNGDSVEVHISWCTAPNTGGTDNAKDEWEVDGQAQLCIPQQGGGGGGGGGTGPQSDGETVE